MGGEGGGLKILKLRVVQARCSYTFLRDEMVSVSGITSGDKRFGTLQLCVHGGDGPQPPLGMIFRGKGTVLVHEKASYHPSVFVMFQEKAWIDTPGAEHWLDDSFIPYHKEIRAPAIYTTTAPGGLPRSPGPPQYIN